MPNDRKGWVKLGRATVSNPLLNKDPDYLALWIHLLCDAAFEPTPSLLGGKLIVLQPGQLTTGRKQLAVNSGIQESKVERALNAFEDAQLIEQQKTNKNRLISILSWEMLQGCEQQIEQPVNNQRTTTEQPVNTLEEIKNIRKEEFSGVDKPPRAHFVPPTLEEVAAYVAERKSPVIPQEFIDHYQSNGWMIGRNKMDDWRAACRKAEKWERWKTSSAEEDDFADVI